MDSRKQFEEWYAEESKDWPSAITVCCKETMWGTWQASRKSIVVNLPRESMLNGTMDGNEVRAKINAAGIRTK